MSRGTIFALSASARRGLVLLWTALLLCSLVLQYAVIAPPTALAIDPDVFELDGNVEGGAAPGDDWNPVYNNADSAFETIFITDPINGNGDKYFDGGQTKDTSNIPNWLWTTTSQPQDKNDISHAYAAAYRKDGHLLVYVGMDRYASNGAGQVGWWFLQGEFGLTGGPANGAFSGTHANGDILVQVDFENGGASPQARVYEWDTTQADNLRLIEASGSCATAIAGDICAIASTGPTDPAWTFDDKGAGGANNNIPAGGMVEAGIDLTALGLDDGCFASFVAETRSSPSEDSTLSDFAFGNFALCNKPDLKTHVRQDGQQISNGETIGRINLGETVYDRAVLTGDSGPVTGTVKFYVCRDADALPDCSTGGTQVGQAVQLQDGIAESANFTPTQLGRYCFRAEYTPAAGSKYLATEHTNQTSECFRVIPADVRITKTAGQASVSAGSPITFTLSWGNVGEGKATGVVISDNLPGKAGLNWSIQSATGTGSTCVITGAVGSQVLTCNVGAINGETANSGSVTLVSDTTPASCGTIENTGSITSTNDGSGSATATTEVLCPDVKITKTPDGGSVSAGDTATFTIKVENIGSGTAKNVVVSDTLPAGLDWTEDEADCSISNGVLTCTVGDLAKDGVRTYTVSADTDLAACSVIDNTATVTAANEAQAATGNNSDDGDITVNCPDITVVKTPDNGSVNAGDSASFSMTVTNLGPGLARNVTLTDTLPGGLTWTDDSADCSISSGVLNCAFGNLAEDATRTVTVTATTSAAVCGPLMNTATVAAANEAANATAPNSDDGKITVLCADVDIDKTADAATVNAGEQIGFTITVTNNGTGAAYNVAVTDTLPAGFTWSINPASAGWSISADGATLSYTAASLAAKASSSVHIVAGTTAEQCKVVSNTATVTTSNDGSGSATATTEVLCPDVKITKTPDGGSVSAGDTATFTIKVENIGRGTAKNVVVSDTLPAGLDWTEDEADCSISNGVLTCTVGDLAKDGVRTYTVSADTDLAACSVIDNTATVTAANEPTTKEIQANNSDDGDITVNCPDITVVKTPDNGSVNAGDDASFSMTVTNLGPGLARNVTLTDTLPAGLTWTDDSADCSISSGVLNCDFGNLAEDATRTVTVTATTSAAVCGPLMNTATVAAANEAANATAPNSDSGKITVLCPDIKVLKTAGNSLIDAGDTASFTVTVENIGLGTAYGVTLDDPLPAGVTWLITSNDEACDIVNGNLHCDFGDLEPGDPPVSVSVAGVTDAEDCKVLTNIATGFATNERSADLPNNTSQAEITVQCPDITVEKKVVLSPVNAGDELAFTITVWNIGPGLARDVKLTDPLPAGIAWVADNDACSIVDGVLTCDNIGDLEPGKANGFTVGVSGQTDAEDCKIIFNTAYVTASNEATGDVRDNNQSTADGEVLCPDVSITKTAEQPVVNAGDDISFEVVVSNNGAGAAKDVRIEDILPTNAGTSWSIGAGSDAGFSIVGDKIVFGPATLAAGDDVTVILTSPTTPATCGVVDNTATMTYTGGSGEDDDSVLVQCPDLIVDKTAGDGEITAGDMASFTMTIKNVGDGVAYNPTLKDTLPAGIDWSEDSIYCSIAGGMLECEFPDMAKGDEYKVSIEGKTSAEVCGLIPNQARVDADNEANTSNNTDGDEILVNCPDLTITKTAKPDTILVGQDLVFEITATNLGPGSAYDVTITDELPAGFAWTDDSEDCTIADGKLTCEVGTLAEEATFTVTISAPTTEQTVEACDVPETIDNTAVVAASNETTAKEQAPNSDDASVDVLCADISLVKVAGTAPDGTILKLEVPGNVTFTYTVTNTGSAALTNFTLIDDHATPDNSSDDVAVLNCPEETLQPAESMDCSITLPVSFGTWTNTAVVTANPVLDPEQKVTDKDDAVVNVPEPVVTPTPTPKPTPKVTPPPTSTIDSADGGTTGTTGLLLILAALAGLMLAAGSLRPARAAARRRDRRG